MNALNERVQMVIDKIKVSPIRYLSFLMAEIITLIQDLHTKIYKKDPCINCPVHKNIGCSHVDSFLCDLKQCNIVIRYKEINEGINKDEESS